jgi:hypothetical protein
MFQSTTPTSRHQTAMGASLYWSKQPGRTRAVPPACLEDHPTIVDICPGGHHGSTSSGVPEPGTRKLSCHPRRNGVRSRDLGAGWWWLWAAPRGSRTCRRTGASAAASLGGQWRCCNRQRDSPRSENPRVARRFEPSVLQLSRVSADGPLAFACPSGVHTLRDGEGSTRSPTGTPRGERQPYGWTRGRVFTRRVHRRGGATRRSPRRRSAHGRDAF